MYAGTLEAAGLPGDPLPPWDQAAVAGGPAVHRVPAVVPAEPGAGQAENNKPRVVLATSESLTLGCIQTHFQRLGEQSCAKCDFTVTSSYGNHDFILTPTQSWS